MAVALIYMAGLPNLGQGTEWTIKVFGARTRRVGGECQWFGSRTCLSEYTMMTISEDELKRVRRDVFTDVMHELWQWIWTKRARQ